MNKKGLHGFKEKPLPEHSEVIDTEDFHDA
jgi:hypothetical protein